MPCQITVRATDAPGAVVLKGHLSTVKDLPVVWGSKQGLPNWIIVEISDATAFEVEFFLENWYLKYQVTTVQDVPAKARLRFEVHPSLISTSGNGRDEITADMLAWAATNYAGSVVNSSVSHMLIDFPKPLPTTIAGIEADFADEFDVLFDIARYYVSDADVDIVVNPPNNGFISLTKTEALATVNDKLTE